jgi:lactoylglutathione lyase
LELTQVRLLVSDFPRCYHFYARVLGLTPQSGAENGPYEKFSPAKGAAGIALQDRAAMAGVLARLGDDPAGHRSLVVLHVDDLDGYCATITGRGAVLLHGPAPLTDRMRVAHIADPEGNVIEYQQWLRPRE